MLFERNQNDGVVYRVVECGVRRFDARVFSANAGDRSVRFCPEYRSAIHFHRHRHAGDGRCIRAHGSGCIYERAHHDSYALSALRRRSNAGCGYRALARAALYRDRCKGLQRIRLCLRNGRITASERITHPLKKLKAPYCGKQSGPSCFSPLKRKDAKLNEVYRKSWSRQDARTDPSLTCIAAHDVGADLDLADSCHSLVVNRMNDSATGGYLLPLDTPAPEQDIDLDRALQPMVVGLTGLLPEQVHPRWQSTVPRQWPVPTDWCAVGVMRIQPDANPVCVHEGAEEGTERWMRDETLDVLCSFYGSHGMQYASRLRDGLTIAQNHQALHEHRMALIDAGELIGAPDFVHQQWIRRYDLALTLRRRVVRAYPILNLKSAQIELRADSGLNVTARIPER